MGVRPHKETAQLKKVAGGEAYDVAEIEETADGKTTVITRKK